MTKFKRKKIQRYNTVEVGIPPLDNSPKSNYPSFTPEIGSFNKDKFHRSANTFSDKNFQLLTNFTDSDIYGADAYRKAIFQGVDLFTKNAYRTAKWVNAKTTNPAVYKQHIASTLKDFKDPFSVRKIPPQDWDQFLHIYGPTKFFNLITQTFRYVYTLLTREQVHSAIFTYYYFYYYFYFTEYILENVYLYFPFIRIFFSNQIFSTFEGVYFSFFQIILGFFIPIFLIFIFSQYSLIRSFFSHKVYFLAGSTAFFCLPTLVFIYYFTGFSTLFIFFFFFIFFSIFFVFYIFEYHPFIYPNQLNFNSYSSYFLPPPKANHINFLPIYYYKYYHWPLIVKINIKNQPFTKFPFTQNVKSIFLHHKRISRIRLLEISIFNSTKNCLFAPTISISGLVFPKLPNNFAYGIQSHRKFVSFYPQKRFSPFSESSDHDYYDNFERDYFPIFVRDFMNHADGFSQISFVEFMAQSKTDKSFDNQINLINDEEFDFYTSIPSKKALEYLYPYFLLKNWLNSINSEISFSDEDFMFQKINFSVTPQIGASDSSYLNLIPSFVLYFNKFFFVWLEYFFDRVTFYSYKKFSTPIDTENFIDKLKEANKILVDSKRLSPLYYKNLFVFLTRGLYQLHKTFSGFGNLSVRQLFTYTLIVRQVEEIYFNVNQRIQYLDKTSLDYKIGNFFLQRLQFKIEGFSKIKLIIKK
jgi:hypothetical protein